MSLSINTRDQAKARARIVRAERERRNLPISHAAALEVVAAECGAPDWNTLSARLPANLESPFQIGDPVQGLYLKQDFTGSVSALREQANGSALEITIDFDDPVDVVAFQSFSNIRHRVTATLSRSGVSYRKTGDGVPHLVVSKTEFPNGHDVQIF